MKKITAILLAIIMTSMLVACSATPAIGSRTAAVTSSVASDIAASEKSADESVVEFKESIQPIASVTPGSAESKTEVNETEHNRAKPKAVAVAERPVFDNGFTTGDHELDEALKKIIEESTSEDLSFEDNLHDLYRHVRDNYKYRKMPLHNADDMEEWLFENVKIMIDEGVGNCYSYAGLLYCLFRAYGFDEAYMCVGEFCNSPHGWVSATINGEEYLFDVETEYASLVPRRMPDHYVDCFYKTHHELKAYSYDLAGAAQPTGEVSAK